jgi:hypothetical protein
MSEHVAEVNWENIPMRMTLLPTHVIMLVGLKDNRNLIFLLRLNTKAMRYVRIQSS